jgi:hypothetical protein
MQDPSKPIWINKHRTIEINPKGLSIFVATPVHSEVSIHYTQACLEFQKQCMKNNVMVMFQLMKSSLVTQGRNLCVSSFMESGMSHLLFIDSDIDFQSESIFKMIETGKMLFLFLIHLKHLCGIKLGEKFKMVKLKMKKN